jgi:hypothetical protein
MIRWEEFIKHCPELAEVGQRLLFQFGPGLAFVGTVRTDGGPRLHPICPILAKGGLYFFGRPSSPKMHDLRRDGRYALHCFPPPPEGQDEEFYCTGRAREITDPEVREAATKAAQHRIHDDDLCFEFLIDRVLRTTWDGWGTPDIQPRHTKWRA